MHNDQKTTFGVSEQPKAVWERFLANWPKSFPNAVYQVKLLYQNLLLWISLFKSL